MTPPPNGVGLDSMTPLKGGLDSMTLPSDMRDPRVYPLKIGYDSMTPPPYQRGSGFYDAPPLISSPPWW